MEAGTLRHWVTFEVLVVEVDSDGAQVETWEPAFDVNPRMPCEVTALSGRELVAAQAVQSKITTRIKVRYRPGFDATIRARLGETVFNIEAIVSDPLSRIRYATLLCSSGVSDGK